MLSHRLRGFANHESTIEGMTAALAIGVQHVEFDVRLTKDRVLIAYHDPFFEHDDGSLQLVETWTLDALRAQRSMRHIPTVLQMVKCFAERRSPRSRLHLDVKIAGEEEALATILRGAGVLDQTVLVSWLSSVLERFHSISGATPLCFSHITFSRFPHFYPVARRLARPGLSQDLAIFFRKLLPRTAAFLESARVQFHDDGNVDMEPAPADRSGCNHAHVVPDLLTGPMLRRLQESRGLVAVPRWCATAKLVERYRRHSILVAVFAVKESTVLDRVLTGTDAHIVYVDNAKLFT